MFEHLVTPSGTKIAHDVGDLARYARAGRAGGRGRPRPCCSSERIVRPVDSRAGGRENGRYEIFHDVLAEGVLAWSSAFESERELALERRRRRRAIAIAAAALLALAAVTAVALFALFQREHAQDAARRANARGLAAQADALMDVDPARSVALAARAAQLEPSLDVERQLREALIGSRVRAVFRARGGAVTDAALSPDVGSVAVASATGWIRVFDSRTLRLLYEFRHPGRVTDIEFSRDGKLLVSASSDGTARLWSAEDGAPLRVFRHGRGVTSVSLSRDGLVLATGSLDGTAAIWELSSGEQLQVFRMGAPVSIATFSPAGDRVAVVSGTRAHLFDPLTGRLLRSIEHRGAIAAIDFSRSGRLFATAGADRRARVWLLDPLSLLHELRRHTGRVTDVAFGPRGNADGDREHRRDRSRVERRTRKSPVEPPRSSQLREQRTVQQRRRLRHHREPRRDRARLGRPDRGRPVDPCGASRLGPPGEFLARRHAGAHGERGRDGPSLGPRNQARASSHR